MNKSQKIIDKKNKEKEKLQQIEHLKQKENEKLKAIKDEKANKVKVKRTIEIKHNYKKLSPNIRAIMIMATGLILSLLLSNMLIKDIQGTKQIFGIQIWLSNLQFWNGRLFSNHDGINWTNNWGLLSASVFYLFIVITTYYWMIVVKGSVRMEKQLYNLIWSNRESQNMHADIIELFKNGDLYKELCSGKIGKRRKVYIDKILYNEIERLYMLWVYPIENIIDMETGSEFPSPDNEK